jgi:sterol desaturase/sphingolipid hydroxylase (fatty acid hydroxylase superfamily)
MHTQSSLLVVLGAMGALAMLETVAPFRAAARGARRLRVNLGLTVVTLALNLVLVPAGALLVEWLRARGWGLWPARATPPSAGASPPTTAALATGALAIAALDLSTWLAHRLMHAVPALWRFHRVHHADAAVDVTTTLRQHPVEGLVRQAFIVAAACALGVPAALLGLYRLSSVLVALLEHANLRLPRPLERALALVITTPDLHKMHHSRDPRETDSNYGNIFSLYDRAFRTFTPAGRVADVELGLDATSEAPAPRPS